MLRSVLAVVAGYLVTSVLVVATVVPLGMALGVTTEVMQPTYLALNIIFGFLAALGGGWVAGWLAPRQPLAHAAMLAGLILLLGLLMLVDASAGQPGWYRFVTPFVGMLGAVTGGFLRQRQGRAMPAGAAAPRADRTDAEGVGSPADTSPADGSPPER